MTKLKRDYLEWGYFIIALLKLIIEMFGEKDDAGDKQQPVEAEND